MQRDELTVLAKATGSTSHYYYYQYYYLLYHLL